MSDETTHLVGPLSDFGDGRAVQVRIDGTPICIVRIGDEVHAIGDTCTHQDFSLAEGEVDVDDCTIECWKHGSAFSLETGEPLSFPATRPVAVYPVVVDDSGVSVIVKEGARHE